MVLTEYHAKTDVKPKKQKNLTALTENCAKTNVKPKKTKKNNVFSRDGWMLPESVPNL